MTEHAHFSKNCDCPMWLQHTARCECEECKPQLVPTALPANGDISALLDEDPLKERLHHHRDQLGHAVAETGDPLDEHMEAPIFRDVQTGGEWARITQEAELRESRMKSFDELWKGAEAPEPHVVSTGEGKEGFSMAQFLADKTEKPYVWPEEFFEPAAGASPVAVMRDEDPWLGVPGGPLPLSEQDIFYPEPITTFQVMMGLLAVALLIGCGIAWVVLT
jgi:hypothetical protein